MSINPSKANSSTTETFVTSLVTNAGLLAVQVGIFIYLKQHLGRVYSPRTYLPPPDKRASDIPKGIWRWVPDVLLTNPHEIIHFNGLDAYLFLRFLRLLMILFGVFTLITYPILLPTDSAEVPGANASDGLEKLSWANLTTASEDRYAAHITIIWILTAFVIFMARYEMLHFVHMRHEFLVSKAHSKQANARTVLITNLPPELDTDHALVDWASFVPGGIERTWIYRDTRDLNKLFDEREKACAKLEKVTSHLLRSANHAWSQKKADHRREVKRLQQTRNQELGALERAQRKGRMSADVDPEQVVGGPAQVGVDEHDPVAPAASWGFMQELVPVEKRPQIRPGKLGWAFIGQKHDSYQYYKEEIARLNEGIKAARAQTGGHKSLGTAFLECNLQLGAHVLAQCVSYHEPLIMANKWIEVSPKDVIWSNLDDGAVEVWGRYLSSWFLTIVLIVLWAFPVAFVGTLSNLDDLCIQFSWLHWVCDAPTPVPGIIQGVLPPVFLALLMLVLPILLRGLAWYENIPLKSLLSVSVYKRYYAFLVIHGFLIVTFSSAVTATIWSILQNPAKTVEELAVRLPDSSVFFLTYMVTQGLSGAASALIQLGALVLHYYQKWYAGRTPRQAYKATFVMPSADFGVLLPRISLLATIGLAYSVISPVINGLAVVSFFLFFLAWKFLFKYVFDQPDEMETGGMYFPLAISNLFVGLYIAQICLTALFALKIATAKNKVVFIVVVVLMALLVVLTFGAHVIIKRTFDPILEFLPMSLATQKANERYRKRLAVEEPGRVAAVADRVQEEVVDLFSRDRLKSTIRRRIRGRPERNADGRHAHREDAHVQEKERLENGEGAKGHPLTDEERARQQDQHDHPTAFAQGGETSTPGGTAVPSEPNTPRTSGNGTTPLLPQDGAVATTDGQQLVAPTEPASPHSHHIQLAPPAPALREAGEEDAEEEYEDNAFNHPATYQDQPWIWLPKDSLGFADFLAEDLRAAGVDASDVGSTMDARGTVEVNRSPPDEEWAGGVDR